MFRVYVLSKITFGAAAQFSFESAPALGRSVLAHRFRCSQQTGSSVRRFRDRRRRFHGSGRGCLAAPLRAGKIRRRVRGASHRRGSQRPHRRDGPCGIRRGRSAGLGNVLGGLERILAELDVDCDLSLPGAFEIGRSKGLAHSPIQWNDSGILRVLKKVPGGTLDPGKLVAGLARAADERGATIVESHPVTQVEWQRRPVVHAVVHAGGARCSAGKILFATNALALALTSLAGRAEPKLTLAVLTEPMDEKRLEAIGLAGGNPFYTVDLPYLWGRRRRDGSVIFGAGLVDADDSLDLTDIDITRGEARNLFESIERRITTCIPNCAKSRLRTDGAARFSSARTGVRSSCRIRRARAQSCWAPTPDTAWPFRCISERGPRKRC